MFSSKRRSKKSVTYCKCTALIVRLLQDTKASGCFSNGHNERDFLLIKASKKKKKEQPPNLFRSHHTRSLKRKRHIAMKILPLVLAFASFQVSSKASDDEHRYVGLRGLSTSKSKNQICWCSHVWNMFDLPWRIDFRCFFLTYNLLCVL